MTAEVENLDSAIEEFNLLYDDTVILDETWEELAANSWHFSKLDDLDEIEQSRAQAIKRLRTGKSQAEKENLNVLT
jgi:hypothetical protein